MNENKELQIKQGLTQFIAALLDNSSSNKEIAAHLIIASLTEEALKLSIDNNKINYFKIKPIIRATIMILRQRNQELIETINKITEDTDIKTMLVKQASMLKVSIDILNSMSNIKEKEKNDSN